MPVTPWIPVLVVAVVAAAGYVLVATKWTRERERDDLPGVRVSPSRVVAEAMRGRRPGQTADERYWTMLMLKHFGQDRLLEERSLDAAGVGSWLSELERLHGVNSFRQRADEDYPAGAGGVYVLRAGRSPVSHVVVAVSPGLWERVQGDGLPVDRDDS